MQGMNIHVHILHGGSPANFGNLGGGVKTPQVYMSHVYMYVYMYVYMHGYIYAMYIHTYVHTVWWLACQFR